MKTIDDILYEINNGIFPPPQTISLEEYTIIEKAVVRCKQDKYLLRLYLEKWIKYIKQ
jgi:hypothetical protein